ncbi:penicillin-binding protein 1C [Phenylobacterium sp.]|jgi:penicillin-binding protein 1C|uniref:penicillin-binding protein 1C n=1 Tax=Phenylobacterium sp. TaxID=1871053 RepID=UPI002F3EA123
MTLTPLRRRLLLGAGAVAAVLAAGVALSAATLPLGKLARSSPVVLDHRGVWLRALPVEDGRWRLRADLERTDPVFIQRLIALEDRHFWFHPGVDPAALVRAVASDVSAGRVRSGGSTLTMQLARRLEPRRRTLGAKTLEAARAVGLEARLGKKGVLAAYLTLAPYGGSLEGVRAASLAYFGHEPSSLTNAEQALLIAIPQAPELRRPDLHPLAARKARAHVLRRLVARGLISPQAAREAAAEPIPRRTVFPERAWAAAGEIARAAPPSQPTIVSTLDARLQTRIESLAAQTGAGQGDESSVGVVVLETRTRAVRALVSSAGRDRPGGWVDATRALRSPGSSLKPFIYAFAFEQGLAAPQTRLADAPLAFAGYEPENFDRTFHGDVTAGQALQYSLNVPAVAMLAKVGPDAFESRIEATGARLVRPHAGLVDPGLALALGGEGVTLRDIAMLYAALGDGGLAKPLVWTEAGLPHARHQGHRLVSADAADQVLSILRESPPPPGRAPPALSLGAPKLAFKTGTSYGFRDAVAAGVGDGWTVVVWTGRPDGGVRPGMTGREAALPLLFQVFDILEASAPQAQALAPQSAPPALSQFDNGRGGPQLLFPPDGASVMVDGYGAKSRGLELAARGEGLRWYVDGVPLAEANGQVVWRPDFPGFYRITAIDGRGRQATARVKVR